MRRTIPMLAGLLALLAGCGEKAGNETGTIAATDGMTKEEVRAEVEKVQLKPGAWEGSFVVEDIDLSKMPGAPAQMEEQMKRMMSHAAVRYCVTPEEAAHPGGGMFSGQENKDCTYSGFEARIGSVKGAVSCKSEGGTMNAVMDGSYAPERYEMRMDMKMEGGPQGSAMAMKARSTGKWVGADCS